MYNTLNSSEYFKCYVGKKQHVCKDSINLHDGITDTSAVTTPSKPRLDRAPRIIPQEKAKYYKEKKHKEIHYYDLTKDKNILNK